MLLSALVAALPALPLPADGSPTASELVKRDATEVIYLTGVLSPSNPPYYLSYVAYYPTTTLGYNLTEPDPADEALGPFGGTALWNTWPTPCTGNTHYEISFPSGALFQVDINYGASTATPGTVVGGGWNGYHGFTCVRDSERVLYDVPGIEGSEVYSLINCTWAS
ncbi:hypothetical protein ABW21_db0203825 [Orbilia brochopaga]|nr:hypothetical protein ABW21_db0203825 [Drechslerella brochopaga]